MSKSNEKTEYILLPLQIYQRFFKDIKISGKKITAVIDEAAIRKNRKRQFKQQSSERKSKKSKVEESEESEEEESDFTEQSSDSSN